MRPSQFNEHAQKIKEYMSQRGLYELLMEVQAAYKEISKETPEIQAEVFKSLSNLFNDLNIIQADIM